MRVDEGALAVGVAGVGCVWGGRCSSRCKCVVPNESSRRSRIPNKIDEEACRKWSWWVSGERLGEFLSSSKRVVQSRRLRGR